MRAGGVAVDAGAAAGVPDHARQLVIFLGSRLLGYLLFASAIWFAGAGSLALLERADLDIRRHSGAAGCRSSGLCGGLAACALLLRSWATEAGSDHERPTPNLLGRGRAERLALGFLTGINLCPPFLVAGCALRSFRCLSAALLFFSVFFVGTAVWFVPFLSLGVVRRTPSFLTVARMVAVMLACWYGYSGASILIERAVYG